jgi:hypothetical protein
MTLFDTSSDILRVVWIEGTKKSTVANGECCNALKRPENNCGYSTGNPTSYIDLVK